MPDRAYVDRNYSMIDGVNIWLVCDRAVDHQETVYAGQPTDIVYAPTDPAAENHPTFRMPESMARALCDALVAHFGGSSDVQTLRKDYLAERARVDKLIDLVAAPRGVIG